MSGLVKLILWIALFIGILFVVLAVVAFFIARYKKCPADKIMVVYGARLGKNPDGSVRSVRCMHGGAVFVWPFIQNYGFLDLTPLSVAIDLQGALSCKNENINVSVRFSVGVSTRQGDMQNAAERLLGLTPEEIQKLAQEIILGQVRLEIASMSLEDIEKDRDKFLEAVCSIVETEIQKIGLRLINASVLDMSEI